jgi:predicted PurR-regulated permease PerM
VAPLLYLTLTLVVMGAGIGYLAPDVSQQTSDLIDRIPQAVRQLEWADRLLEHKDHFIGIPPTRDKLSGWPLASLQPLAMR